MSVRVVVVEDHPIVVTGLAGLLAGAADMQLVGQAATLAEARPLVVPGACDVVLLDLRLPDGNGIELLEEAASSDDAPGFIVLSSFMTPEYVSAALALGASGFLLKTTEAGEILDGIRAVAQGRLAYSVDQLRSAQLAAWAPLTPRERDLLAGVVAGRTNDEIAGGLGLSGKTVEKQLARLFARFGVSSRTDLALAVERGAVLDLPTKHPRPGSR
jgi:DNA-binding NarL/FixJ family response regulator